MPDLNTTSTTTPTLTSRIWHDDDAGGGIEDCTVATMAQVAWTAAQTIRNVAGTTDTPTSSDAGKIVTLSSGSATTVTINGSLDLSAGQRIDFAQLGAGQVTFSASGATVNGTPGLKTRTQYSAATLICTAADTYLLVGDLAA